MVGHVCFIRHAQPSECETRQAAKGAKVRLWEVYGFREVYFIKKYARPDVRATGSMRNRLGRSYGKKSIGTFLAQF